MNIVMRQTRQRIHFEVLCDLCHEPMDISETISYVFPRSDEKAKQAKTENNGTDDRTTERPGDIVCHSECGRKYRVPGWIQMTTVESLINNLQERHRNRHPALVAFIKSINERKTKPIK